MRLRVGIGFGNVSYWKNVALPRGIEPLFQP